MSSRSFRRVALALTAVAMLLIPAYTAQAQGTSGTLPDPITTSELRNYLQRVEASEDQMAAAMPLHEQYLDEFSKLRESEIADYLEEMRSLQGGGFNMPARADVESFIEKSDKLMEKIADIDNRFVDSLAVLLTDQQAAKLPRVKLARERDRYRGNELNFGRFLGGDVDLSTLVDDLEMNPDQAAQVDQILAGYEVRLTKQLADIRETTLNMFLRIMDELAALGYENMSQEDFEQNPDKMQEMMEAMQSAWRNAMRTVAEEAAKQSELNQKTFTSLHALLPKEAATEFRSRYYSRAYPEAHFDLSSARLFRERAAKSQQLNEDQRTAAVAIYDQYLMEQQRLTEEMVELIDQGREDLVMLDFMSGGGQEYREKLQEFQERRTELQQNLQTSLVTALGEDYQQKFLAAEVAESTGSEEPLIRQVVAENNAGFSQSTGVDAFVPQRITHRELSQYMEMLGLADDSRAIVDVLYDDYTRQFEQIQQNELTKVSQAVQQQWDSNAEGTAAQRLDRVYEARRVAREAIAAVDKKFFDEIQAALLSDEQLPAMQRVRLAREREGLRAAGSNAMNWQFRESYEHTIDLTDIVYDLKLDPASRNAITPLLFEHEKQYTQLLRDAWPQAMKMQRTMEELQAEWQRVAEEGSSESETAELSLRWRETWQEQQAQANKIGEALRDQNRATMSSLMNELDSSSATGLKSAYNRRAFPEIFADDSAAKHYFEAAMRLPSLTNDQRQQLTMLRADYAPRYDEFSEAMLEFQRQDVGLPAEDRDWVERQAREDEIDRIEFQRDQLNEKTILRIRAILTEEQRGRVGGRMISEPDNDDDFARFR